MEGYLTPFFRYQDLSTVDMHYYTKLSRRHPSDDVTEFTVVWRLLTDWDGICKNLCRRIWIQPTLVFHIGLWITSEDSCSWYPLSEWIAKFNKRPIPLIPQNLKLQSNLMTFSFPQCNVGTTKIIETVVWMTSILKRENIPPPLPSPQSTQQLANPKFKIGHKLFDTLQKKNPTHP